MKGLRGVRRLSGLMLLLGLLGQPLAASAHTTTCRTDPTITLSNGYVVTMWADISTDISNVTSVNYVLHVPAGVTMTGVSYDANGYLEHLSIVADQKGTHYADETTVYTTVSKVSDTAYATRQDTTVATKSGTSGTTVTLNWCT